MPDTPTKAMAPAVPVASNRIKTVAPRPQRLSSFNCRPRRRRSPWRFRSVQVLAAVRSGLLVVAGASDQAGGTAAAADADTVADVPPMQVGAPGHADILREASHYLSAIKVCFVCSVVVCRAFVFADVCLGCRHVFRASIRLFGVVHSPFGAVSDASLPPSARADGTSIYFETTAKRGLWFFSGLCGNENEML